MRLLKSLLGMSIAASLAWPAIAQAAVYLNGTSIDGALLNQKLERCTVTFDGHGNVFILAPGYQVESVPTPGAAPATATTTADGPAPTPAAGPVALTKKYFVVSEQSMPGMTQYDVDLYVNSKWVRKFHSDDEQVVADVTQYMHPGPNKVLFVARKNLGAARRSFSPDATYRITLGEGDATGDKVVIDNPLVTFKRSADQTEDTSQEFSLQGR